MTSSLMQNTSVLEKEYYLYPDQMYALKIPIKQIQTGNLCES